MSDSPDRHAPDAPDDVPSPPAAPRDRPAAPHHTPSRSRSRARSRRRIIAWSLSTAVLVVLLALGFWLAGRVQTAQASLDEAQTLIQTLRDQADNADFAALGDSSKELSRLTGTAVEQTEDPLWRTAELIPVLGTNLTAVRGLAETADSVAVETVAPLAAIASRAGIDLLKPVDGKLNVESIVQLSEAVGPAYAAFHEATVKAAAIDFDGTIAQVAEAGDLLNGMLAETAPLFSEARSILDVAPGMLGVDGPRTYLLIFENLAETTALGGTAAAMTEITVDNGAISITRQASSQDFTKRGLDNPAIPIDPGVDVVFNPHMYMMLNLATSRPDFPTAAQIASSFWDSDIGSAPDAVVSVDPVALSYLLGATGPIAMSTGEELNADNAVPLLLNEVYFRYQGPDGHNQTDAFFADAAARMFEALMSFDADPKALTESVARGVTEHRIMAWSSHPEEQAVLAGTALSGILPTTNDVSTTTGVFFRDMSVSKMDYYLHTATTVTTDVCTSTTPTFTATVDLRSGITPEQAANLPAYVASGPWGGEKFKTQVFLYGPPGTSLSTSVVTAGGDEETFVGNSGTDLGRPVATFWVMLAPGETKSVSATFTGPPGDYAAPDVWTTPMLNPTTVTLQAEGCAAG